MSSNGSTPYSTTSDDDEIRFVLPDIDLASDQQPQEHMEAAFAVAMSDEMCAIRDSHLRTQFTREWFQFTVPELPYHESLEPPNVLPTVEDVSTLSTEVPNPTAQPSLDGKNWQIHSALMQAPNEIRNRIYFFLFKGPPILFAAHNFDIQEDHYQRSSAFLRTCKRVHDEGSPILYGQNYFVMQRDLATRGNLWEAKWNKIGYHDIYDWTLTIGFKNLSLLRRVSIGLADGDSITRTHPTQGSFTQDVYLKAIIWLIAEYSRHLEHFSLGFCNQFRMCESRDFINLLRQIKTEVLSIGSPHDKCNSQFHSHQMGDGHSCQELTEKAEAELVEAMVAKRSSPCSITGLFIPHANHPASDCRTRTYGPS